MIDRGWRPKCEGARRPTFQFAAFLVRMSLGRSTVYS